MNAGDINTIITNLDVKAAPPQAASCKPGITAADILASMTFEEKMKLLGFTG